MEILFADRRVCVCVKPAGVLSTDEPGGMPELIRAALGGENPCVRSVHRLDRTVGGVMVYARSRMAASLLSEQIREGRFEKTYLAVVCGVPETDTGELRDLLRRDRQARRTFVADAPGKDVREAVLRYETIGTAEGLTLLRIGLGTGRTHQIRVQFASRGLPLWGDGKYGRAEESGPVALWSNALAFDHPETGERLRFTAPPPGETYPWSLFEIEETKQNALRSD